MLFSWLRSKARPGAQMRAAKQKTKMRAAKRASRLRLEVLEDRCLLSSTVTITSIQGPSTLSAAVPAAVEGALASPSLNAVFTDTNAVTPANLNVTVDYGDGTPFSSNQPGLHFDANLLVTQIGGAIGTTYTITDQHTFPEESGSSVPPFSFNATLTVKENANAANTDTRTTPAEVTDASLSAGDPGSPGTPQMFSGVGGTSTSGGALNALNAFATAIGGQNNGDNPFSGPSGFRRINWDGVKVDGTDFGGQDTVITSGHTVGIPLNRFESRGVFFGAVYAVTNDGFVDVNPAVNGLFPAFTAKNTFAMFNDNGIDFKFVAASPPGNILVSAASRGFGAIFINVQTPNTSSIEFFHGSQSLGKIFAPVGGAGVPVFIGELLSSPIVTSVELTLGTDVIFKFDGTTVTAGSSAAANVADTDDFVYAEPVPIANGFPIVSGSQGSAHAQPVVFATPRQVFTGAVASFSDLDPNANAKDFTATINWGDGHLSNGTIVANANGGFDVVGTNTYTIAGLLPINVDVMDFGGSSVSVNNTAQVLGDKNFRYVAQLYQDLLGRVVDATGLISFGSQLDLHDANAQMGLTRQQVVNDIESSMEFVTVVVNQQYLSILHRPADASGLHDFVAFVLSGGSIENVRAALYSSSEFFALAQMDNTIGLTTPEQKFVDTAFTTALNRHPDGNTLAAFTQVALQGVTGRFAVGLALVTSAEGFAVDVTNFYVKLLHRVPDQTGLNGFVSALLNNQLQLADVIAILATSDEYFALVP
jgi:hypothetical protein